jgi:putative oxidoreductase
MEAERKDTAADIGLLILRVGIGGYLITHGWGKLQMLLAGGANNFGDPVGLGSPLSLVLVTASEFLCALLIILGLATRLAALPVVICMSVAAFVVHARDPWTMEAAAKAFFGGASKTWFSKEPALLYLIPFLSLVFTGGGKLSLDGLIAMRRNQRLTTEQRGPDRKEIRAAA